MTNCRICQTELPEGATSCRRCGVSVDTLPGVASPHPASTPPPTVAEPGHTRDSSPTSTPNSTPTPGTSGGDTFRAGSMLQGRYRIVGLRGSGGMGSVYRAIDQLIGQEVALKFLAEEVSCQGCDVEALRNEVRIARRVSHPNVCRVYDIGELEGRPFISMEYVDGEDLASLQQRIGRLAIDKAAQVARQMCAGLHAAHEQGVLHRDFKPANVMLDARGNVRIADFGIAAALENVESEDRIPGTPAYMAPELFTGEAPSVASDIYSLGLVLYELYTGRAPFAAKSMTELLRKHRQPVPPPTTYIPDLDPDVERIILQCLARNPKDRPRSALAVLAALPGGDPLAEALASGKTPSPELVAAAGGSGRLGPAQGWALVGVIVAALIAISLLDGSIKLLSKASLPHPPVVLEHMAQRHLAKLGYATIGQAHAAGFDFDQEYVGQVRALGPRDARWSEHLQRERTGIIRFWFRQHEGGRSLQPNNIKGRVTWNDPPVVEPGMAQVRLDPGGRLRELLVVPRQAGVVLPVEVNADTAPPIPADWEAVFEAAGLELARFQEIPAAHVPPVFADLRSAWEGRWPEDQRRVRVEGASLHGLPVSFLIVEQRFTEGAPEVTERPGRSWRFLARIGLVLVAFLLALHAARHRRGNLAGALRVGFAVFSLVVAFTVLAGDHSGGWAGLGELALKGMLHGLAVATEFSLYYYALEPHVRRVWPETIISWSRLLAGRWRDPLVGQHVLVGLTVGVLATLVFVFGALFRGWTGGMEPEPFWMREHVFLFLMGPAPALGMMLEFAVDTTRQSMMIFMSLVVARMMFRSRAAAVIVTSAVWSLVWLPQGLASVTGIALVAFITLNLAFTLSLVWFSIRFGLLALVVGYFTFAILSHVPLQAELSAHYSNASVLTMLVLAALAFYGMRIGMRGLVRA